MLWFAPNDAWDRPHEPIHIVNAFYDGPIGKKEEKCLVGILCDKMGRVEDISKSYLKSGFALMLQLGPITYLL